MVIRLHFEASSNCSRFHTHVYLKLKRDRSWNLSAGEDGAIEDGPVCPARSRMGQEVASGEQSLCAGCASAGCLALVMHAGPFETMPALLS